MTVTLSQISIKQQHNYVEVDGTSRKGDPHCHCSGARTIKLHFHHSHVSDQW